MWVTNYGSMGADTVINGSLVVSDSRTKGFVSSNNSNFAMQSFDRKTGKKTLTSQDPPEVGNGGLRPTNVNNRFSVGRGKTGNDADSVGSDESTRGMIIRKEVACKQCPLKLLRDIR
jgi:hypothetical protein